MSNVSVYDVEYKRINDICEEYDITQPELIEILLDAVEDGDIKLEDWL